MNFGEASIATDDRHLLFLLLFSLSFLQIKVCIYMPTNFEDHPAVQFKKFSKLWTAYKKRCITVMLKRWSEWIFHVFDYSLEVAFVFSSLTLFVTFFSSLSSSLIKTVNKMISITPKRAYDFLLYILYFINHMQYFLLDSVWDDMMIINNKLIFLKVFNIIIYSIVKFKIIN